MIDELKLSEEEIKDLKKRANEFNCDTRIMYIMALLEKANDMAGVTVDFGTGTGALGCKASLANTIAFYVLEYR